MKLTAALVCTFLSAHVSADIYLHNPRGSNNRLDEQGRERNNGNRLFDSQNNNRGGMNVGTVYYYEDSNLQMEWSPQHTCGNNNNHCEMVLQYMCDERLRDGTTTTTIPIKPIECYDYDCDTDVRFGRHESFDYYTTCTHTERNKGLFTASQNVKGHSAKYTRQNPNGQRRGYECPEERDYYPYWRPSPWRDIGIFTNQEARCKSYQAESENVLGRYFCDVPIQKFATAKEKNKLRTYIPITEEGCKKFNFTDVETQETITGVWKQAPSHGIAVPECLGNFWTRDNHHGNTEGGQWPGHMWTAPKIDSKISELAAKRCTMRLRYNITTNDMVNFDDSRSVTTAALTAVNNKSPGGNNQKPSNVTMYANPLEPIPDSKIMYFPDMETQKDRDYTIRNNPQVDMFGSLLEKAGATKKIKLQLAVNTAQYGRTFQDRTHRFELRKRPAELADVIIHNVQVRGKRGNIVQTYPATEYDFTPNELHCAEGEYVHFQWTGSNTNPNNNDGQGRQGSDRSNVVPMRVANYEEPTPTNPTGNPGIKVVDQTSPATFGHYGNSYPDKISDDATESGNFLGLGKKDLMHLAILDNMQYGGEMSELDDAGTYFDLGPKKCQKHGFYNYMCTRNNNFSNRSQKGRITVNGVPQVQKRLGTTGGAILGPDKRELLRVEPDALHSSESFTIGVWPSSAIDFNHTNVVNAASKVVKIEPLDMPVAAGKMAQVQIDFEAGALSAPMVFHSVSASGPWEPVKPENLKVETDPETGRLSAIAQINEGGYYVVEHGVNGGLVTLIVFIVLGLVGGIGYYLHKRYFKGAAPPAGASRI